MYSTWFRFVLVSLVLIVAQVWVLSPWELFRVATPYLYPFALLLLPIGLKQIPSTVIGFVIGSILDLLYPTPGLHASALTAVGFARYYLLRPMISREIDIDAPALYTELQGKSIILLIELLALHHFLLFALDGGWMIDLGYMLLRFGSSLALSLMLGTILLMLTHISLRPHTQHGKR